MSPGKSVKDVSWNTSRGRLLEDVLRTSPGRRLEDVLKKESSRLPFQINLGRLWDQIEDVFTTSLRRLCIGWVGAGGLFSWNRLVSSHLQKLFKLGVLKNVVKLTGKYLCRSFSSITLRRAAFFKTFLRLQHSCFLLNFVKF